MATVELKGLGKVYASSRSPEGVRAVRDANLAIRDGEFVVLVGPSGCGKSTLLRMIAGLEPISEGELRIDGRLVNDEPARARDIAMVFQNYALYPHLTVRDNMAFGLERRRSHGSALRALVSPDYRDRRREETAAIDARVRKAAETLGLVPYLDRFPRELSGGQRQRVAVGRAIVRDPKVFLFDEPLSNLDAKLRHEMRAELRQLHRQLKATMVYVTHDQEEAMGLGDRLVVLRDGLVQQIGTPADVYDRPANRFVASFVGTPSINLIEGRLHRDDGRADGRGRIERFVADGMLIELPDGVARLAEPGPITLGIRPDRLRIGRDAAGAALRCEAVVIAVEQLGDRADITLRAGPHRLVARVAPECACAEGTTTTVGANAEHMHFFAASADGARVGGA
jgi:multiple sugar transport system ATP-binding protein